MDYILPNKIKMKTFDTFEEVEGMNPCMKKPLVVHAKKINEPFTVNTLENTLENPFQGKAGGYLMKGIDGELYICDEDMFKKTYDFIEIEDK